MNRPKIGFLLFATCLMGFACTTHHKAKSGSKQGNNEAKSRKYYEQKYGISLNGNANLKLYSAVDKWIGVPHKMGSCESNGIDCSCLVNTLCREAYNCNTPRDTKSLYERCKKIGKEELTEGDIVFFQMKEGKVDHVGLYLCKGKFVHTSVKKGVMVSDLNEPHFARAFKGAGRIKC